MLFSEVIYILLFSPVEEKEDDVEEEEEITASTNEPAIMRAWPPMSDGKNHPKAKSKSLK